MKKLLVGLLTFAGTMFASALTVDTTVSDHCVLQQGMQNTVMGTTTAGRTVTVSFGGSQVGSATADSSGDYAVKFNPGNANATGRNLVVSDGSESVTVSDVLVGEVWLVAGQSNAYNSMDFNEYGGAFEEWMSDINYPNIRVAISSPQSGAGFSLSDPLVWQQCTTANRAKVAKISPLAFFFAKELYKGRNVPVGITLAGMGATAIGYFMTPEAIAAAKAAGKTPGWGNGEYAAYITRFDTVAARGAVWYQGETDAIIGSGSGYGKLLTALIEDWRQRRGDQNFPVIVCGFANFAGTDKSASGGSAYDGNYEGDYKNSTVRQEQEMVAQDLNNVVVYQNVDLSGNRLKGYARAEHPDQKPESARRAYLAALNLAYGQSSVRYRCPYPTEAYFNADKTKVTVSFPSSVSLTKTGEYVHFPYRLSNGGVKVNPNSVTVGADGHSLEIGWTGLTVGSGDTKLAFCNVSGAPDDTPLYEIKIVDQDGFTIPPFELKVKDSSTGGDTHTHVWGTPTYTWTASDTICIATRKCTVSGCTLSQNVTASSVTLTVTTAPTADAEGAGYRTAVFSSPYTTQTKNVTIPKLNPGTGVDEPGTTGGGTGDMNGHDGVQLWADGPYWAKCNVGASSETDGGLFFSWGGVDGFKVGGYQPSYPFGTNLNSPANGLTLAELKTAGICDASGALARAYDAASVNMGGDWRMPTKAELNDLKEKCDIVWDDTKKGLVITGKGDYESASIFLPCPGYVNQNGRANDKFSTNYLSSSPSGTEKAWSIFESSYGASVSEAVRLTGFPVRGVITITGSGSGTGDDDPGTTGGGDTPGTGGDTPVEPTPAFASADYYVSPTGNDSNNGTTRSTAFKTIAHAIDVASAGQKICVLKGTYEVVAAGTQYDDGAAITVGKDVTVFGETGNPADVVVRNTKEWSATSNYNKCYRVFKLNSAGAVLSGITAENGIARGSTSEPKFYGSNIKIDTNGGTVTNCIIRNGRIDSIHTQGADPSTSGGGAIACFSQDGLITHCVISNNFSSMGRTSPNQKTQSGGTAVFLKSGTLRESLVAYNTVSECWTGSAVFADEATDTSTLVDHCTIAYNQYVDGGSYGNYSDSGELYPIWVPLNTFDGASRMPEIRNCLIYGNQTHKGGKTLIDWTNYSDSQYSKAKKAAAGAFVNCATDMTAPDAMSAITVTASDMEGLVPKSGTALASANVGCTWLGKGSGGGRTDDPGDDDDENVDPPESGATGTLDGHEGVQLWANGPYWATMNCGATKVGQAGSYYAGPGDTKGLSVSGGELTGKLVDNGSTTVWGNGWRRPTESDFQGLVDNTVYLGAETIDGQPNIKLGGKADPYKDTIILIPVAGWGNNNVVNDNPNCWGTQGRYWGSTQSGSFMRNLSIILGSTSMKMELVSNHAQNSNIYTIRMCCDSVSAGHTHTWGTPTYEWIQTSAGYKCKATGVCTDDASHVIIRTVTATYEEVAPASLEASGTGRYTATFNDAPFTAQTKDVVIPKLHEHTYDGEASYVWTAASGGFRCTATLPCGYDGCSVAKSESVTATYREVTPATETATGLGRYTATFADSAFTAQTKDVTIPMIPVGGDPNGYEGVQLWKDGPFWAKANVNAASEKDEGTFFSYAWVEGFTVSGYHVSYPFGTTTESPAVGMTLAQLKNAGICDSSGVLAKAYDAASVHMGGDWRMPTKSDFDALLANCDVVWDDTAKGLSVTGRGDFDDVSIFLPCPGYANQNGRANDKFQTYYLSSTPTGTDEFYGLYMAYNSQKVDAAARANGFPVRGVIDSIRGYVPHSHAWSAPSCVWTRTSDGYECTATVTCGGCSRTRSETVTATYAVIEAPTASAAGVGRYTATFVDATFGTQTKDVEIARLHDHVYGITGYSWSADRKTCTASAKCVLCDETKTETVTTTYDVTQPPTETEEGVGTYTATFADAFFATQTKNVSIPKVVVIVADYYVSTSGSDSNSGLTRDDPFATIAHAVSVAASGERVCVLEGVHEISATIALDGVSLVGEGFEKTIVKPASGSKIRLVTLDGGATVEGVTLTGGNTASAGAGICVLNGTVSRCCISNNTMTANNTYGGGVSFSDGKGTIDHSIVADNKTTGQGVYGAGIGGGAPAGTVTIDTCLIYGNAIAGGGAAGGIGFKNTVEDLIIRNCTVVDNKGAVYTGGIDKEGGSGKIVLINTIAYGNTFGSSAANLKVQSLDTTNSKNCFFGLSSEATSVSGSLSGNPLLGADYRLTADSPAIGAGAAYDGIGTDLDGKAFAETPSIGCYEYGVAEGPHDHVWGDPEYVWIATDEGYACVASVACECGETLVENGTVTSTDTTPASCTTDGERTYKAVFETLGVSFKTVTIPGGHDWGEVVYRWDLDAGTCSAVSTCQRDASHTQTVDAVVSCVVTKIPTALASGVGHYVATFADGGLATQSSEDFALWRSQPGADDPGASGDIGNWYIPGTEGGLDVSGGEDGVKSVAFTSIATGEGRIQVGFAAVKAGTKGQPLRLVCKDNLEDKETFTIDAVLSDVIAAGTLEGATDKSKVFVIGIAPAK